MDAGGTRPPKVEPKDKTGVCPYCLKGPHKKNGTPPHKDSKSKPAARWAWLALVPLVLPKISVRNSSQIGLRNYNLALPFCQWDSLSPRHPPLQSLVLWWTLKTGQPSACTNFLSMWSQLRAVVKAKDVSKTDASAVLSLCDGLGGTALSLKKAG